MAEPRASRERGVLLLTGVASFTGAHIARACRDGGFRVVGALTRGLGEYSTPLLRRRLAHSEVEDSIERAPFGSERLNDAIREMRPEIFVHHGADLKGYRNPNFDVRECVRTNSENARAVFEALAASGCRRFVSSGTFFEPDGPRPAVSAYGVAKAGIWEEYRKGAAAVGLATTKIFIPNPVGPLENEDRLMPSFAAIWKGGGKPIVRTPHLVRDNLPAPWLARRYVEEAWRIVDPVLAAGTPVYPYDPGHWGPAESGRVVPPGGFSQATPRGVLDPSSHRPTFRRRRAAWRPDLCPPPCGVDSRG